MYYGFNCFNVVLIRGAAQIRGAPCLACDCLFTEITIKLTYPSGIPVLRGYQNTIMLCRATRGHLRALASRQFNLGPIFFHIRPKREGGRVEVETKYV